MIAILGGLGAAVSWAIGTLCSSRSSRMIGPASVLAWVMIIGFLVSIPSSVVSLQEGRTVSAAQVAGMLVNGVSYTAGLLLAYRALVIGRVSIVTPIVSTEGAGAALGSVVLGEALGIPTAIVLAVIAIGVVLASIDRRADEAVAGPGTDPDDPEGVVPVWTGPEPAARPAHHREDPAATRRSVLLAISAAVAFSIGLISSAHLGDTPISWILLSSRGAGLVLIAIPLVARRRLRLSRRAVPLVLVSGVLEVVGSAVYVTGAHVSAATAAVLGSQFAAIAAVSAFIFFGERLARIQVVGVSVVAIGVAALAIVRG
ncbi:MAG: DMT family transporter [Chloroflexi bacterium]|nr:DMT family transporter [Chloroflexota bacterium]